MAIKDIVALVDELIPGDADFPCASATGVHGLLNVRLRELSGSAAINELNSSIIGLATLDAIQRSEAVRLFEQNHPDLFGKVRMCVYLAYYEQPAVIETLRALGFDYNDAPLPDGYALAAFDPDHDWQEQPRGHWVATEDVGR